MELTGNKIREVTFGAKVRGYDPAEVDEFIAAVADGVDELQERLRRAVERATRAEQQLAAGGASIEPAPVVVTEPVNASAPTTSEISKVWERAVTAAEEAVSDARQTAQKLLDDASRQSESTVASARAEAQRLSEEGQRQLRADIAQLEAARDQLRGEVESLTRYLDEERSNVRTVLNRVITILEEESKLSSPPSGSGSMPSSGSTSSPVSSAPVSPVAEPVVAAAPAVPVETPEPAWQATVEAESAYDAPAAESVVAPQPEAEAPVSEPAPADVREESNQDDGDQDPFLAELRRAVKDDQPLGPRDTPEEDPINGLYADDDDEDKKGFFPWKK
jgi:DivIVA domain-containing protein